MENRLGAEGQGFGMLMTNLARERLVQAVRGTILAEEAIRWTVAHTRERKAFGRTIADFQNTRFVLAELAAKTTAARAMTDGLIALQMDGTLDPVEAGMAKLFCTDLQCEVLDRCLNCSAVPATWWKRRSPELPRMRHAHRRRRGRGDEGNHRPAPVRGRRAMNDQQEAQRR